MTTLRDDFCDDAIDSTQKSLDAVVEGPVMSVLCCVHKRHSST